MASWQSNRTVFHGVFETLTTKILKAREVSFQSTVVVGGLVLVLVLRSLILKTVFRIYSRITRENESHSARNSMTKGKVSKRRMIKVVRGEENDTVITIFNISLSYSRTGNRNLRSCD